MITKWECSHFIDLREKFTSSMTGLIIVNKIKELRLNF
ncbi:MAG: hypothetical protein ACJAU1_001468, partial [Psychromonas sp.]